MTARRRALMGLALALLAGAFLWRGLTAPSVEFTRLFFLVDRHSILSVIEGLLAEGETFLGGVLALFSVAFPALKIACLAAAATLLLLKGRHPRKVLALSSALGRWSMLDVLVLALVVFYVKRSGLADATTLPGIWFFAGAVVLTILSALALSGRTR